MFRKYSGQERQTSKHFAQLKAERWFYHSIRRPAASRT